VDNLIFLSLGVGMAAGVFVDGSLLRGKQGYAGQIGHTRFSNNGITCSCGKQGCWVTEIGASALLRKLTAEGVEIPHEVDSGIDWLDLVLSRAQAGDPRVLRVLNVVGRQIGQGAARLVQTFNPSVLIVGGRMGKLMQLVEPAIRAALLDETLPSMAESLDLVVSGSGEDHLMGCLATVYDSMMKNPVARIK
jgi:predicted NBD/HSP70 family sugar kinase